MGRLIYFMLTWLDGFIGDGEYSWSAASEDVLAALTADAAERSTYLCGRRLYGTMAVWETEPAAEQSPESAAFATTWQAADNVVFSSTLTGADAAHPVGTAARRAGAGQDQSGEPGRSDHRRADARGRGVAVGPGSKSLGQIVPSTPMNRDGSSLA
jgi:hypothetical protein